MSEELLRYLAIGSSFIAGMVITWLYFPDVAKRWELYAAKHAPSLARQLDRRPGPGGVQRARRLLAGCGLAGLVIGFVQTWNVVAALGAAALGLALPAAVLHALQQRRVAAFEKQLLDVVTMLANSLKTGVSLQPALEQVISEMEPPASEEFQRVFSDMELGATLEDALIKLDKRIPLPELEMLVTSVVTLNRPGARMAETFDTIAYVLTERRKVEGKIRVLTSQGLMQMNILCAMPFALLGMMWLLDKNYVSPLFDNPLGWVFLALVLVLVAIGRLLIRKIVTIEV